MISETIQIVDVTKTYGDLRVLQGFSLSVRKGEFVSIVGPSGCGKSTLLKIIGGITKPSSGVVMLDGEEPQFRRKQGHLGFVFQNPVLLPWRTLEMNVRLPWEVLGRNGQQHSPEHVREILATLGLSGFEHAYPRELSGGMQQRAALARALIYEPKLLLMDEPFGAVDELTRGRLNFELLRVWERLNPTIVFVTHALDEAVLLSDRIVVVSQRPATILAEIPVPLRRPRTVETLSSEDFQKTLKCVRDSLNLISAK